MGHKIPRYVGSDVCKSCHENEYRNFITYAKKATSFRSIERVKKGLTEEEVKGCYACHTTGYGKPGETITAYYRSDGDGERWDDAAIPGLAGVALRLGRMDAENKVVEALVIDPSAPADPGQPARFSVDFSVKPMIVLLWTGLVVLLLGGVMAVARRTGEFTTATAGESA
jgi:hypothetical protein